MDTQMTRAGYWLDILGEAYLGCPDNTWPMACKSRVNPIKDAQIISGLWTSYSLGYIPQITDTPEL